MMMPKFIQRSALGRVIWGFRRELMWVGVFSFFANLLMLTPTLYMLQLFDRVMLSGNEITLAVISLLALLFLLVMGFAEWLRSRLLVRKSAALDLALATHVFDAAFARSLQIGATKASQAFSDLTQVRQFLTGSGVIAFFDTPWSLIYIGVLFLLHPWLGWASVAFAAITFAVAIVGTRISTHSIERANDSGTVASTYVATKLRNAETVEALGMLGALRRQWTALHDVQQRRQGQAFDVALRVQSLTKYLQYLQSSLMLALAALLCLDGQIGLGTLVASNSLAAIAMRPIGVLVGTWRLAVEARSGYRRLDALLAGHSSENCATELPPLRGQIEIRDLTATAPGRAKPILAGLSATFAAGEVVAIVGPSGAGKSTFVRCLLGVWPDASGEVLIDGVPVRQWPIEALRPNVGFLPQDIELFEGTIAENIARFSLVDSESVIQAAHRTGIHDLILRLPRGYDTQMGEAGGLLSGGQRQRIGLARALYGSPKLVVLDEPNASLDDAGEAALIRAIQDLKGRGTTVFIVVHQPQMLAVCDRVLLLEAGRITKLAKLVVAPSAQRIEVQPS